MQDERVEFDVPVVRDELARIHFNLAKRELDNASAHLMMDYTKSDGATSLRILSALRSLCALTLGSRRGGRNRGFIWTCSKDGRNLSTHSSKR
jgi:hypothetical protein